MGFFASYVHEIFALYIGILVSHIPRNEYYYVESVIHGSKKQ